MVIRKKKMVYRQELFSKSVMTQFGAPNAYFECFRIVLQSQTFTKQIMLTLDISDGFSLQFSF